MLSPRSRGRRPTFPAAVALALFLAWAPAAGRSVRAAGEEVLPSRTCRGLWIVPISFGDGPDRTLEFVLDTGAGRTSIDPDSVERLTGRRPRPGKSVRLRNGEAGPLKIRKLTARAHDMDHLGRALGTPIDGILGFPVFEKLLLTLDYPAGEVRVGKGTLPDVDARTVFEDVGRTRPFLAISFDDVTIPVLVDSGYTSGLTLRESDPLIWDAEPRPVSASVRFSEIQLKKAGRLARDFVYGPLTVERPIVEIVAEGTRLSGEVLMRRFVWTFDQRAGRIRMIPDGDDPILSDPVRGTGLALLPTEEGLEVVHVFPDTPAAESGLLPGDLIVAVDGTAVYERGCISWSDIQDRDTTVLSIRRATGERFDIEVGLRVLVP